MIAVSLLVLAFAADKPIEWKELVPGTSYARIAWIDAPKHGDGILHVVRIDPAVAAIAAYSGEAKLASEWAKSQKLAVVINAGMFEEDFVTHTGYFRIGKKLNAKNWSKKYQSVLAFGPRKEGVPRFAMIDRDLAGDKFAPDDYELVVQNLRLIKAPGTNVWAKNGRAWSEAAIASDREHRLLFLFSRSPLEMYELNQKLLALPLGVETAAHLEGGPEASLSIHAAGVDVDLCGSYETGFNENDGNKVQWRLPNVLAVKVMGP